MVDHDKLVGDMLNYLDQLGIANDTWPDGAMMPSGSEKNTNSEGAFRVPMLVHWPGKIKAGTVSTEIIQHHDYLSDGGDVLGMRYDDWKVVFMEQRCVGTLQIWAEPFIRLRLPKLFNLRTDPYERADITSPTTTGSPITTTYCLRRTGSRTSGRRRSRSSRRCSSRTVSLSMRR